MSFYGNITNANKSTFQFDKIYANRFEMDSLCDSDGVFIGRFVLVDYNKASLLSQNLDTEKMKVTPAYLIIDENGKNYFFTGPNYTTAPQFLFDDTSNHNITDSAIKKDGLILVVGKKEVTLGIEDHTVYDPSQSQIPSLTEIVINQSDYEEIVPQLWKCVGADINDTITVQLNGESLTCHPAAFEKLPINYGTEDDTGILEDYNANYTTDLVNYPNAGRGWDSTVWQKTWKDGQIKYAMVAELNSIAPAFDISIDAPTETPLTPHFSSDSSNMYYKLHVQPQWGFRIKGKVPNLYTTDEKQYPSDVNGSFVIGSKLNGGTLQKTGLKIKVDQNGNPITDSQGRFQAESYGLQLNQNQEIVDSEFNAFPLAIYWNKAGFDPYRGSNAIKDMIRQGSLPTTSAQTAPAASYIGDTSAIQGENLEQWASKWTLKDSIAFRPSGLSENEYNKHSGELFADEKLPDTYELSIMLPSLGQAMSDIWDIVYGKSGIKDINGRTLWHKKTGFIANEGLNGQIRNANYEWDTYNGNRLVSAITPEEGSANSGGYLKYNKDLMNSLAANINSVHDLMGMIIRDYEEDFSNVANWDPTKIYFINGAYYKKNKTYVYNELTDVQEGSTVSDSYVSINNMVDLASQQDIYRIDEGEFPIFEEDWGSNVTQLNNTKFINYRLASGGKEKYIDGAKYVTINSNSLSPVNLTTNYEKNKYYTKSENGLCIYNVDSQETPTRGANYYNLTYEQCQGFEFYVPYRYWMLRGNSVKFCTESTLAGALGENGVMDSSSSGVTFYRAQNITAAGNEGGSSARYTRTETTKVVKELTLVPEDSSRYEYNNSESKLIIKDQSGNTIETIPSSDIVLWESEDVPKSYYAPKYKINNSSITLTVWARELYNAANPEATVEWELDNNNEKIPEHTYEYVLVGDVFSLESSEQVPCLKQFEEGKYFIGTSIQSNGETVFTRFTEETYDNLRGTTYGQQRNTLDSSGHIQYYTITESEYLGIFYNIDGNYYYKNAQNDLLRETSPKIIITDNVEYYSIDNSEPVTATIFVPNRYYYIDGNDYILAESYDSEKEYYELKEIYISESENSAYKAGDKWNPNISVPEDVTLATRSEGWEAKELKGFAQDSNTLHGLILEIDNKLLADDKLTRDKNTVQGAINSLNDIINGFGGLTPNEFAIVDEYGQIKSAPLTSNQGGRWNNIGNGTSNNISANEENWISIHINNGNITAHHEFKNGKEATVTVANKNTGSTPEGSTAGLNQGVGDTIDLYTPIVDSMGHVIGKNTETVTLPYGFKTISTGQNNNLIADNTQDTATFSGDTWIQTTASSSGVAFTHIGPDTVTERSDITNLNPAFGASFTIEDWRFDDKGHKAGLQTHTVTIPQGSLSDVTANGADVITQLSLVQSTGALSTTRANVGSLTLTGYTPAATNPLIAATDSIYTAFEKIANVLDNDSTSVNSRINSAINGLEAIYDTGEPDPENQEQNIIDSANLNELLGRIRILEAKVYALENPESNNEGTEGGGE